MAPRILFVDDNPDHTKYLRRYLEIKDYDVSQAKTVTELFGRLEQNPKEFDLLVLDIMLPTDGRYESDEARGGILTGMRILDEVNEYYGHIPVLLYSVLNQRDIGELKQGQKFHRKNDPFEEIEETIKGLLEGSGENAGNGVENE